MEVFDVYVKASKHFIIKAESIEEAEAIVENMTNEELLEECEVVEIEVL